MKLLLCIAILTAAAACGAELVDGVRHVSAGPEDIIQVNTATFEYTSIVLPDPEKAMTYLCGDPKHWDVQIIENAERFVNIKPSPGAHPTDIQILTDHNHNYTVKAEIKTPVDIKLFLESTDIESLRKPPSFVPASQFEELKKQIVSSQGQLAATKGQTQQEMEKFQADYARKIHHVYTWGKDGHEDSAPFHIKDVFDDSRFTYIRADTEETASFYEIKDSKQNLVELHFDDGLYRVDKVISGGELRIGKKRIEIFRKPGV